MNKATDLICILFIILCILKYIKIMNTCKINSKKDNKLSLSGCEVAQKLLEYNKLDDIYVVQTKNPLYEKYDSNRKVIKLSKKDFDESTITSMVKAAREVGYALLDKKKSIVYKIKELLYMPLNIITFVAYIGIIASSFLRDFYFLKVSLIVLLAIIIIYTFFYNLDKCNFIVVYSQLEKNDMIDEDTKYLVKDLIKELNVIYVLYPIHLIYVVFQLIKRKIND